MNLTTTHVLWVEAQSLEFKSMDEQLKSFWELESLGIQEREKTLYDDFATHIAFRGVRYQVALPWKEFHEPLPDNYLLVECQEVARTYVPTQTRSRDVAGV